MEHFEFRLSEKKGRESRVNDGQESKEVNNREWKLPQCTAYHVCESPHLVSGGCVRILVQNMSVLLQEDEDQVNL